VDSDYLFVDAKEGNAPKSKNSLASRSPITRHNPFYDW
jgi:hypothetical protein